MDEANTMTGTLREKHKGVPTDNGGRYAEHDHDDDIISLIPSTHVDDDDHIDGVRDYDTYVQQHTLDPRLVPLAQKAIDDANKRLARYGIEGRFEGTFTDGVIHYTSEGGIHEERPVTYLELNRPRLSFDGWSFTGVHDVTDGGQMIHFKTSNQPVPDVTDTTCDFCGKSRRRERVYTLHSDTEGDKQVGKSCLEAFIGVKPKGLWALEWNLDPEELEDDADGFYKTRKGIDVFNNKELLAAAAAVSHNGAEFTPKSRASMEHPATAEIVQHQWEQVIGTVTDDNRAYADEVLAWLRDQDDDGDYLSNLKASLLPTNGDQKWVKAKHLGIAASAVSAYRRAQEREVEQEAREAARIKYAPGFVAPEGAKVADVDATVIKTVPLEGSDPFGRPVPRTLVSLVTSDGHQVTWFASGSKEFELGKKVKVAGTVKEHSTYRDTDQTVLTRAKITDPETGAKLGDYNWGRPAVHE